MSQNLTSPRAVRDYLNSVIRKYESWEELVAAAEISSGFISETSISLSRFKQLKTTGVGREIIKKFLGGNWTNYMVENALSNLAREDELEAIEKIESPSHAREFRKAIAEVEAELKIEFPPNGGNSNGLLWG